VPRHIAVTGAGTGIGRAIALRLAERGASLTLLARDRGRLEETAHVLESRGARVATDSVDIRDPAAVDQAFERAKKTLGPLHVLVANSGVGGSNQDGPGDRWDEIVRTNLDGTYHCLRAAARRLAEPAEEGEACHLVVVSSILARIGVAGYTAYCASKAGLLGLVRALAMELAPRRVQVNAVCPGWVDTDMARAGLEEMARGMRITLQEARRRALEQVPLGRMAAPEDVAGLVAWLVSKDARGVTGQGIDMNGGAFMT
jgi:NAD(P)-dependent dehydrogenase (short-subunit alcohol dehydrogenase family)